MAINRRELKKEKFVPGLGYVQLSKHPKNVLVTGNKGLIGSCLWKVLREDDDFVASSFSPPADNIVSLDEVMYAVQGMKCIVHLAAEANERDSIVDPWGNFRTNVGGTMNIIRAAREHRVERVVFASTVMAEYPSSPYDAAKAAGEAYLMAFHKSYVMGSVILRFDNVYGKYCMNKIGLVSNLIKSIIVDGEVSIYGDGTQSIDLLYSEDASDAIMKSLEVDINTISGKPIPIGTGILTTVNEVVDILQGLYGSKIVIRNHPEIEQERNFPSIDPSIASDLLKFTAITSLEDGLKDTYQWMETEIHRRESFHKI